MLPSLMLLPSACSAKQQSEQASKRGLLVRRRAVHDGPNRDMIQCGQDSPPSSLQSLFLQLHSHPHSLWVACHHLQRGFLLSAGILTQVGILDQHHLRGSSPQYRAFGKPLTYFGLDVGPQALEAL